MFLSECNGNEKDSNCHSDLGLLYISAFPIISLDIGLLRVAHLCLSKWNDMPFALHIHMQDLSCRVFLVYEKYVILFIPFFISQSILTSALNHPHCLVWFSYCVFFEDHMEMFYSQRVLYADRERQIYPQWSIHCFGLFSARIINPLLNELMFTILTPFHCMINVLIRIVIYSQNLFWRLILQTSHIKIVFFKPQVSIMETPINFRCHAGLSASVSWLQKIPLLLMQMHWILIYMVDI